MKSAELCAGYGGLALAIEEVFGARTAWFSEFESGPSRILAHRWPGVPNHGDMTKIDWAGVEKVDVLGGGTPCQDLSHCGRRAGMTEGTRSNLWVQMREAIATIQPRYVVWENVRGAYSAGADSEMEPCPGCVGDAGDRGPVLRALGRVLGDLSDLGYDCQWRGLRAADVGAPHGRFRVFVLATRRAAAHAAGKRGGESMAGSAGVQGAEVPLPRAGGTAGQSFDWGDYADAITRWETVVGRPAPDPVEWTGRDGGAQLSPWFSEWMMGMPAGWIADVPGVNRNEAIKAAGNGVVPQQAAAALRDMLAHEGTAP